MSRIVSHLEAAVFFDELGTTTLPICEPLQVRHHEVCVAADIAKGIAIATHAHPFLSLILKEGAMLLFQQ